MKYQTVDGEWLSNPENKRTFDASHPGNDVALDFFLLFFFGKGHKHQPRNGDFSDPNGRYLVK